MKSKGFKGLAVKSLILASALAFVNCDDSVSSPNSSANSEVPGVEQLTDPAINPGAGDVSQPGVDVPGAQAEPGVNQPAEPGVDPVADDVIQSDVDTPSENPQGNSDVENPVIEPGIPESSSSVEIVEPEISSSSVVVEPASSSSAEVSSKPGIFLSENGDEDQDQLQVERMEKTGPDGGAILAWPKNLSEDPNVKHAVVVWGPGGGTEPGAYGGIINRLASHGFVVIALSSSPGDASKAIAALDWLETISQEPGKPLYNKIDFTKVGCSGHSMGGLESEQALIKDKRVITAIMNNSGDLGHSAMSRVSSEKTIAIVYGEGGMERPNAEADYNNAGVTAPACLIKMSGGQGSECQQGECGWGHGSGPWGGMAATVSWMRWHLGGEESRKADFVGSSGKYINGPIVGGQGNWRGQCKNF